MLTHETLARAAEILEDGKWIQGALFDNDGGMCLYGAIRAVANEQENLDVYWDAMKVLHERKITTRFNDEPGRAKAEVVALLRAISAELESKTVGW